MKTCKYKNCKEQINTGHDEEYCIFHAPKHKKGISVEEFNELILERIKHEDFFFEGYIFPGGIVFDRVEFLMDANFYRAQFSGDADFKDAQFSGEANFNGAQFSGEANFNGAQFSGAASFYQAQFSGWTNFSRVQFSGEASFHQAQFSGNAHFLRAQFSGETNFKFIGLSGELVFTDTKFDENCRFTLRNPKFDLEQGNRCLVIFERVQFNPYLTYFENIDPTKSLSKADDTSIGFLFRYCQLKDVYFSNCNLSNFSFYKSSFDEARFVSSHWGEKKEKVIFGIPYTRKNIIFEEVLFDELKHQNQNDDEDLKKTFKIEDIDNYSKIEILYQRMKAALDRAKGFSEAGWFYFNEFEMKRQALRKNLTKDNNLTKVKKWFKRTKDRVLILLKYDLYFIFAGYGEKPFWSFW